MFHELGANPGRLAVITVKTAKTAFEVSPNDPLSRSVSVEATGGGIAGAELFSDGSNGLLDVGEHLSVGQRWQRKRRGPGPFGLGARRERQRRQRVARVVVRAAVLVELGHGLPGGGDDPVPDPPGGAVFGQRVVPPPSPAGCRLSSLLEV